MAAVVSEDYAEFFWYFVVADDLWVVLGVLGHHFARVFLHLDLKVVLCNFIPAQIRQRWILNQNTSRKVIFNDVAINDAPGLAGSHDAAPIIANDAVILDAAHRVDHHNSIVVASDLVVFDQQVLLALYHEDALGFRILYIIELYAGFT